MVDRASCVAYYNEFSARQLGVSQHELLGKNISELFPPAIADRQRASLQRVFESGESFYIEAPVIFAGRRRWLGTRLSPIKAQHGETDAVLIVARDITERREAEQALEASEHRFRALIENSADAIALIDADGIIQFESPAATRILGYNNDEMVGHTAFEFLHPDDIATGTDSFAALLQAPGAVISSNIRYRCKDGSFRWMAAAGTNLLNEASVRAIVLNYRDVTEHKQAEARVQRQLQRLSALRTIDLAISSTFDMDTSLTVVLSVAVAQLGIHAAAVLIFNPEQSTLEYAAGQGFYHSAIQHTRLHISEGCTGQAAGQRKVVGIPNLSQAGKDFGRAELLQAEAFLSYYAVPLIVKGELKGMLEVFHRTALHPDQEWLDFLEILAGQAAIAIDNAQLFERLQRAKTELEQRVAERTAELNQINVELEHANHAKDEFLASMSHELRTPLNSILGMSETLLEERRGSLNAYQQRSVQHIESSGRHLLDLINDILDLSKIEAGKLDYYPQPVAVDEVCRSGLSFVRAQAAKKSITIDYDNQSAFPEIMADVRRLKQILVNLLTNAVKFTPDGGHVTLQVRTQPEQDLIQFSVIDDGIGIAEKDLLRLFQPFTQVDSSLNRRYEGTGLGLALVQKLTDLHGGSVEVESDGVPGKGSRFTINLPCLSSEVKPVEVRNLRSPGISPVEQTKNMPVPPEEHTRGVILLAEDNMPNVLTIGEYLESYGYKIVVAHDGLEAIAKAEQVNPDVILMDIQMPAMDGLEATRRLRANPRFASTPIIALTALTMPGDRERCLEAGASEYMSKPVSLKALVHTIINLYKAR
jgi:PAS domain S-box-containing protein